MRATFDSSFTAYVIKRETLLRKHTHTQTHTFHLGLGELLKFVNPMDEGVVEWNGWHRNTAAFL